MTDFSPHITVATVVEHEGRYLLVEERDKHSGNIVYNQPAGHLEAGESIIDAAVRETLEETAYHVEITGLLGLSLYTAPSNGVTYYRQCFSARVLKRSENATLDKDIINCHWYSYDDILALSDRMRSPLVLEAIAWHRAGRCFPLTIFNTTP